MLVLSCRVAGGGDAPSAMGPSPRVRGVGTVPRIAGCFGSVALSGVGPGAQRPSRRAHPGQSS